MRDVEATMPAIAPIEDLRAAQKERLSIYAMHYLSSKAETTASEDALCPMLYKDGVVLVGKISVNYGCRKGHRNS
jgi:hypothetical protein